MVRIPSTEACVVACCLVATLQWEDARNTAERYYTRNTLHRATVKLTDFGRAVPYRQLAAARQGGTGSTASDIPYTRDGIIVMGDPGLRPPEVGMVLIETQLRIYGYSCSRNVCLQIVTNSPGGVGVYLCVCCNVAALCDVLLQ